MIDRDRILEFVETWRVQLIAASAGVLLVLMIVLVLMAFAGKGHTASAKDAAMKARAIDASELWLPAEPLGIPGVQLFSEPGAKWSVDEAKKWYTVPDDDVFGKLRSISRKPIDTLLESVP